MHIAILTHGISPFGHGYCDAFRRAGHKATLLSLTPMSKEAQAASGARIVGSAGFKPWESEARWPYARAVLPLRRAVKTLNPDILFGLYLSSAGLLACLSGHPRVVISAHGGDVHARAKSKVWSRIYRWMAGRACFVHAVSDELADIMAKEVGLDRSKFVVLPIGIDTRKLVYVDPTQRPGCGEILTTRAYDPVYDQLTFLRALKLLDARGVTYRGIFASGRRFEGTREAAKVLGLEARTVFLGGYADEELSSILGAADIYVSSSKSDGTSQSLLEAMSSGLFPVVSDIPANRSWVTDGVNGFLFPAGDEEALATKLENAMANASWRAKVAMANRALVEQRGDVYVLTEHLLRHFERCLTGEPVVCGR